MVNCTNGVCLQGHFNSFESIDLPTLNEKAKMLERNENKYIFTMQELCMLVHELKADYDILEINGKRSFTYETIYFDDKSNVCFIQHHQKKRQRFKARTRRYVDSNLHYFEFKLKDLRNKTNKKRYACEGDEHGILTPKSYELMQSAYQELYSRRFKYELFPASGIVYKRITLVAKEGGERLTIDFDMNFFSPDKKEQDESAANLIIIETKSVTGNGIADKIFKKYRQRSTGCSKFCLSKIFLGSIRKYNGYRPILKKYFRGVAKAEKLIAAKMR